MSGTEIAVRILYQQIGHQESRVRWNRDRLAPFLRDSSIDGDSVGDGFALIGCQISDQFLRYRNQGGRSHRVVGLTARGDDLTEAVIDGALGSVTEFGSNDTEPCGHDCRNGESAGDKTSDRSRRDRGRLNQRRPSEHRGVIRLGRLNVEIELAFGSSEESALSGQLEPNKVGCSGGDTDGRRIEGPIDTLAGVNQVQSAVGEAVAVVLDHELVQCPASSTLQRLQHDDPTVVERRNHRDCLGDHRVIG